MELSKDFVSIFGLQNPYQGNMIVAEITRNSPMRKRISRIRPVKQPASCHRERIQRVSKGIRIVRESTYYLIDEQIFISEDKSVSSV